MPETSKRHSCKSTCLGGGDTPTVGYRPSGPIHTPKGSNCMIGGCDIRPAEPPPRPEAAFPMSAGLLKRVGWLGDVPAGKWLVRCGQEKRDAVDVARVTEGGVDAPRASVWRRRHTAGWRVRGGK